MFDPSINLGNLLTIACFFVGVVIYVVSGRTDAKVLEARLQLIDAQMEDFKLEIKKLGEILIKQALQDGRIANIETRMLMGGQRVDSMEETFRKFLLERRP